MLDVEETIQSQYAASPTINALVKAVNNEIDPRKDIELLLEKIVDPSTAEGEGLDYWARIVNLSRYIEVSSVGDVFGFKNSLKLPFDVGIFYEGKNLENGTYIVEDNSFRELIFWKAKANIGDTSLYDVNHNLKELFNEYGCYIVETDVMKIEVLVFADLTPYQTAIFGIYKNLLVGAGVEISIRQIPLTLLGFTDGYRPFGEGVFYNGQISTSS